MKFDFGRALIWIGRKRNQPITYDDLVDAETRVFKAEERLAQIATVAAGATQTGQYSAALEARLGTIRDLAGPVGNDPDPFPTEIAPEYLGQDKPWIYDTVRMGRRWYAKRFVPDGPVEFWEKGEWHPYSIAAFQERERAAGFLGTDIGARIKAALDQGGDAIGTDRARKAGTDGMVMTQRGAGESGSSPPLYRLTAILTQEERNAFPYFVKSLETGRVPNYAMADFIVNALRAAVDGDEGSLEPAVHGSGASTQPSPESGSEVEAQIDHVLARFKLSRAVFDLPGGATQEVDWRSVVGNILYYAREVQPQPEAGSGEEGGTGQCRTCGTTVALADDGTVESHRAPKQLSGVCFGTGEKPAPETLVQCDICDRQIPEESARFDGEAYFCTKCVEPAWNESAPTQPLQGSEVERGGGSALDSLRPASKAHLALEAAVLRCLETGVWPETIVRFVNEALDEAGQPPPTQPESGSALVERCSCAVNHLGVMFKDSQGKWVEYDDYTALQAQAEQHKAAFQQEAIARINAQNTNDSFQAQLQRVEKERDEWRDGAHREYKRVDDLRTRVAQAEAQIEAAAKEFERRAGEGGLLRGVWQHAACRLRENQPALSDPTPSPGVGDRPWPPFITMERFTKGPAEKIERCWDEKHHLAPRDEGWENCNEYQRYVPVGDPKVLDGPPSTPAHKEGEE